MKFFYENAIKKSGVYKIINTHTNRIYIGQCKEFKNRWYGHKISLLNNKHQNKFLLNDYNKCKNELGHDDFLEFHVLEVMENSTKEERNQKEEFYIASVFDKQENCYNFKEKSASEERSCYSHTPEETSELKSQNAKKRMQTEEGRKQIEDALRKGQELLKNKHPLKGTHISKETRQKMSIAKVGKTKSEETKKRMSEAQKGKSPTFLGKSHTEEFKDKMSKIQKGNKNWLGKKHSEESISKMRMSNRNKPLLAINIVTNESLEFISVSETSRKLQIAKKNIYDVLKGIYKQIKGYKFSYIDK